MSEINANPSDKLDDSDTGMRLEPGEIFGSYGAPWETPDFSDKFTDDVLHRIDNAYATGEIDVVSAGIEAQAWALKMGLVTIDDFGRDPDILA